MNLLIRLKGKTKNSIDRLFWIKRKKDYNRKNVKKVLLKKLLLKGLLNINHGYIRKNRIRI